MRLESPASEVTGVPEAEGADDKTEPIRTAGPDAAPQSDHVSGQLADGLFGAVTVVPALLGAAWLLPGLAVAAAALTTAVFASLPAVLLGAFGLAALAQRSGRAVLARGRPPRPPRGHYLEGPGRGGQDLGPGSPVNGLCDAMAASVMQTRSCDQRERCKP